MFAYIFCKISFWINSRLFWGVDRLHFVKQALGKKDAKPQRLLLHSNSSKPVNVRFYFDFSSPWSYLGSTQIEKAMKETNVPVQIELFPILLGALFKNIGTPNLPASVLSKAKLDYSRQDFDDWVEYHNVDFTFSPHFPLRTVLPLRIILSAKKICSADDVFRLFHKIYRATWVEEKNIADSDVLRGLLLDWNYPVDKLFDLSSSQEIKDELISNTTIAQDNGCCGVPSFQVDNSDMIWGQDRLNIVQDMVCGWRESFHSKL